jgi:hypothetical protein
MNRNKDKKEKEPSKSIFSTATSLVQSAVGSASSLFSAPLTLPDPEMFRGDAPEKCLELSWKDAEIPSTKLIVLDKEGRKSQAALEECLDVLQSHVLKEKMFQSLVVGS